MSVPSVGSSLLGTKNDAGKYIYGDSVRRTSSYTPYSNYDTYGRDGLCRNSLFSLYPGRDDCVFHGLITTETNMRPAYWRFIGDCDGGDLGYVGGSDQMVLGYPNGPRGFRIDVRQDAIDQLNPMAFGSSPARQAIDGAQRAIQNKKTNYSATSNTLATSGQ